MNYNKNKNIQKTMDLILDKRTTRRQTLKGFAALSIGMTSIIVGKSSIVKAGVMDNFFNKHYKEMTNEYKEKLFKKLIKNTYTEYGVNISLSDPQPIKGVRFVYCLNLSKCNGSRRCVTACVNENNQSRNPAIQYIKVLEMNMGSINLEAGDMYYEGKSVPNKKKFYLPVQCHQCHNAPCVTVCPVEATWVQEDGICVIDFEWCIGCRYCMAACPYGARRFNFKKPSIPRSNINPNQGFLSNIIKSAGVVEKCHFCLHRTRNGDYPACLEACPTGARKFGNLNDPDSEVSYIIRKKRVFVLKEELNTIPSFFYYFD